MVLYTIVRNANGDLHVPYVIEDAGGVHVNWNWLDNDWNGNNPSALSATLFISLRLSLESFVL